MANGTIRVPPDSTGKKVDAASLDNGVDSVYRQRIVLADDILTGAMAAIRSAGPLNSDGGLVTRNIPYGIQQVNGIIDGISATVNVAGNFTVTQLDRISATVNVAIATPFIIQGISTTVQVVGNLSLAGSVTVSGFVGLTAGSAVIGTLRNISRTVQVQIATPFTVNNISAGVVLAAGTALIGDINAISRTVQVAIGTPFTVNNISAAVALAAGTANIGFINNISATVNVAVTSAIVSRVDMISATVNVAIGTPFTVNNISATVNTVIGAGTALMGAVSLAAGTSNIGIINNISATVVVALANPYLVDIPSASHGPRCVTCSTSAAVALIAAPGANLCLFITSIACTNGSATLTRADAYPASATASAICGMYMAASGGGFVQLYDPPVKVLSNTAVNCRVKPSVSQTIFNVNYYVAAG